MKKNKKRNRIMLLLILLLGITIGFAALATTLKINGNANITKNTWSVYWDEDSIAVTQGSKGDTIPDVVNGEDGSINTKVNWNVNLEVPGDFYEFTIDAANAGTLDAMITGITPTLPQDLPSYVSYSVTYADGLEPAQYHLLPKGTKSGSTITPTTEKYKVRIEFLNTITPEQMDAIPEGGLSLDFGYEVQYGQADDNARNKPVWILPNGKTANNLTVGDELCIKDQCFNFIRYDGNDVVMLAKYNLKVGSFYSYNGSWTKNGEYSVSESGYGKQAEESKGWEPGVPYKGTVKFSQEKYWIDNPDEYGDGPLKPKYGSSYPADVYDNDYVDAPYESNYSVAYYVNNYGQILEEYGATISDVRLLTGSEVENANIGCNPQNYTCPTTGSSSFISNTSFWLGTMLNSTVPYAISSEGDYGRIYTDRQQGIYHMSGYMIDYNYGVRPVIVVEKNNL